MLHSMTGFGAATSESEDLIATVEIKAVNGRFLKVSTKASPRLSRRETELESLVRQRLHRGSLTVSVELQPKDPGDLIAVNEAVARAYQVVFRRLGLAEERIPMLPGVLGTAQARVSDGDWEVVRRATEDALTALLAMRAREGAALAAVVSGLVDEVETLAIQVAARAPVVVEEYQTKLADRVKTLLKAQVPELGGALDPEQLAREVALYADRCDVTEEIDRLAAHIGQARELIEKGGEAGRSLEFVAQEMHREVNTIGSKSSDVALSKLVVKLKTELEKLKEQLANIE